jgi:hypothetical protein
MEEYAAPPPIDETQYHAPQAGARHNFNKKTAETVNHWGMGAVSLAHNPTDHNNLIQLTKSPQEASTRRLSA